MKKGPLDRRVRRRGQSAQRSRREHGAMLPQELRACKWCEHATMNRPCPGRSPVRKAATLRMPNATVQRGPRGAEREARRESDTAMKLTERGERESVTNFERPLDSATTRQQWLNAEAIKIGERHVSARRRTNAREPTPKRKRCAMASARTMLKCGQYNRRMK